MGATRFNVYNQFILEPVTGTNTYHSIPTNINQQHNIGIDYRFTGSMTGTISVECSNDGIVFTSLSFTTEPLLQPTGTSMTWLANINEAPFYYLRVSYVNISGSGTFTSILTSKDLG